VGTRANGVDNDGDVPAEAIGDPLHRSGEEAPGPGRHIGRVERGRLTLDADLAQARNGLVDLGDRDNIRAAERTVNGCSHKWKATSAVSCGAPQPPR
jgi:hypothetical protein